MLAAFSLVITFLRFEFSYAIRCNSILQFSFECWPSLSRFKKFAIVDYGNDIVTDVGK